MIVSKQMLYGVETIHHETRPSNRFNNEYHKVQIFEDLSRCDDIKLFQNLPYSLKLKKTLSKF